MPNRAHWRHPHEPSHWRRHVSELIVLNVNDTEQRFGSAVRSCELLHDNPRRAFVLGRGAGSLVLASACKHCPSAT